MRDKPEAKSKGPLMRPNGRPIDQHSGTPPNNPRPAKIRQSPANLK